MKKSQIQPIRSDNVPITNGDYLAWYNQEINRYRDHEWQLSSFSLALTYAIVFFAKNDNTKALIPSSALATSIIVLVCLMIVAQIHTHKKLNKYRERRELLLKGKTHKGKDRSDNINIKVPLFQDFIDFLYFFGFVLTPTLFGIVTAYVLGK